MSEDRFQFARPNLIESDEGFSVEVLGRTGILYKEGDRVMKVSSEVLAPGQACGIALWSTSIQQWEPPYHADSIDQKKRSTIVDNIRRTFRSRGTNIEVIG